MNIPSPSQARAAAFVPKTLAPTDEQATIQTAVDRTIIVEANAGAAKTTTLALRMAESWRRGTPPERFLALTYTPTACDALRAALRKVGMPAAVVDRLRIATFEAFCEGVLDELLDSPVPRLHTDEELKPFVWEAIEHVAGNEHERWRDDLVIPALGDHTVVEEFLRLNLLLKGTLRDTLERADSPVSPDYAAAIGVDYTQLRIFLAYERIRQRQHAERPEFRGPTDATYDLARWICDEESPDLLRDLTTWPHAITVLMVDEMHDLNQAMFTVLRQLLTTTRSFFCGVGDFDQVLHGSTGADARFMGDAIDQWTTRRVVRYPLTSSYRFGKTLAIKVGRVAGKAYDSLAAHETRVSLAAYDTPQECARRVVQAADEWRNTPKEKLSQCAVLLRHPHQSVHIENALLEQNIPYTTLGLDSYLMRPEVLFIRGLLAVATDNFRNVADDQVREKVMQALIFFGGGRIEVKGREHDSQAVLLKDAIEMVKQTPSTLGDFFANHVLRTTDASTRARLEQAVNVAREQTGPRMLSSLLAALQIDTLVRDVYVSKQRREDALGNLAGLELAAQRFATATDYFQSLNNAEQKRSGLRKAPDSLLLASVIDVKGLEFDHVVIPFLAAGEFPAPSATGSSERNVFYVGATRARRYLTMFARADAPSVFVGQMGYTPAAGTQTGS